MILIYTTINFKTKKALKDAVKLFHTGGGAKRFAVTIYAPGLGTPVENGIEFLEGPHYPEPHRWYAQVEMKDGYVVRVIK